MAGDSTNLYIRIVALLQGMAKFKMFGNELKLLSSTFRAVFRTTAVVAFFMVFRSASQAIHNTIEKVKTLVSESAKLQFTSQQTASIMSQGGAKTAEYFKASIAAARQMSTETMFSAQKIQEGLFRGAMAGFKLRDSIAIVNKTLRMATIAGVDFRNSMSGVIGVTRAFEVGMKELPHIADTMMAAFSNANMTFTDLITAMKYVAPVAVAAFGAAKETFIDTTAALMSLSNSGLNASKSGVYLRGTMLKLMGASNKVTTAFAKYGVNLYEGEGKAKKYMGTMIKGQKAMSGLYDTVTRLKDAQYDLLLSGESGTVEYKKIVKELGDAKKKLTEYGSGINYVQEQFRTAGGRLKPLSSILTEIQTKIPGAASVLTKIFGVRGGAGIATLLTKSKDFEANVKLLSEVWKESEKGKSILKDIFVDILKTALVKWTQIKNTVFSIFNVIAEAGLESMAPVLDTVLGGLKNVLTEIEDKKGVFEEMFKTVVDSYLPEIKEFFGTELPNLMKKINVFSPEWSAPLYKSVQNKEGKWEATKVEEAVGETPGARFLALGKSMASYFIASFLSLIRNHKQDFNDIGEWIALGLETVLKKMYGTFILIGGYIAKGAMEGMAKKTPITEKLFTSKGQIETALSLAIAKRIVAPGTPEEKKEDIIKMKAKAEELSRIAYGKIPIGKTQMSKNELEKETSTIEKRLDIKPDTEPLKKAQEVKKEYIHLNSKISGTLDEVLTYIKSQEGELRRVGVSVRELKRKSKETVFSEH